MTDKIDPHADEVAHDQAGYAADAETKDSPMEKTKTSYRKHDWFVSKNMVPKYGIEAKAVGWEVRWCHCAEDGKPMIFDTEEERDSKLKELRRKQPRVVEARARMSQAA